jgi:glycerate 2-kinase
MDAHRFFTHSLQDPRATRILAAALDAVEPGKLVRNYLLNNPLPKHNNIYLLGIGKASEPMIFATAKIMPHFTDALAITKHASRETSERVTVIEGGHPIPDERSVEAGEAALKFVSKLYEDDLLICLISGGGSALMTAPQPGISLADTQSLTKELLSCGASIDEINLLRSKLDRVKGGGLALATKAKIVSLILSDVLGNPLEFIASGPTVMNSKTNSDARSVLEKYDLPEKIPVSIMNILESDSLLSVQRQALVLQNKIIGDINIAMQSALKQAQTEGFDSEIIDSNLHGEASEVGAKLAMRLKEEKRKRKLPFCMIAGGETTVTIRGNGKGGRNQELTLASVNLLNGMQDILLVSLATDGDDGPTDAAGAVVSGETCRRAEMLGVFAADHLARNDAYTYFESISDLIKSGYTGTNVNDLILLFGF